MYVLCDFICLLIFKNYRIRFLFYSNANLCRAVSKNVEQEYFRLSRLQILVAIKVNRILLLFRILMNHLSIVQTSAYNNT